MARPEKFTLIPRDLNDGKIGRLTESPKELPFTLGGQRFFHPMPRFHRNAKSPTFTKAIVSLSLSLPETRGIFCLA